MTKVARPPAALEARPQEAGAEPTWANWWAEGRTSRKPMLKKALLASRQSSRPPRSLQLRGNSNKRQHY